MLAQAIVASVSTDRIRVVLHELNHHRGHLALTGTYSLAIRKSVSTLFRRSVHVPH